MYYNLICILYALLCGQKIYSCKKWVLHRFSHFPSLCHLCSHDLLGSGDGYQCVWFFCVGQDLWQFSRHSHCHTKEVCNQTSLHNPRVCFIQSSCAQQLPAETYSASAVDKATEFCFFEDHEIRDLLRSWQVPEVLFLSILQPA
jgi:hypothetical protein